MHAFLWSGGIFSSVFAFSKIAFKITTRVSNLDLDQVSIMLGIELKLEEFPVYWHKIH